MCRESMSKEKGTNGKCKGPGTGACLACIHETARKPVTEMSGAVYEVVEVNLEKRKPV